MGMVLNKFVVAVPHNSVYIIEHLGKYHKTIEPGLNFIIPFIQRVPYQHSLKEQSFQINAQNAVTKDNVIMQLDGVLYLKINDPVQCSYGSNDPILYSQLLAQSIMRAEIGKLTLDQTFEERDIINKNILDNLKNATEDWGIQCLRYEIKDIKVSDTIRKVMNLQAESERKKRAEILLSEGKKTAYINMSEAKKMSTILESHGEAERIMLNAEAVCERIKYISKALNNGPESAEFQLALRYIESLEALADPSKNIVLKANLSDPKEMMKDSLDFLHKA